MVKPPITISIEFVRRMLAATGQDTLAVFDSLSIAEIDAELLKQPLARITGDQFVSLFRQLVARLDDEGLRLFSRKLRPGTFALLARSTIGSRTALSALRRICDGFNLIQDDVRVERISDGDRTGVRVILSPDHRVDRDFVNELTLLVIHRVLTWLSGSPLRPDSCEFTYPAPAHADEYIRLFPCKMMFGSNNTVLWMRTADLSPSIKRDSTAVQQFLRDAAKNLVMPHAQYDTYYERVRDYLRRSRPEWPGLAEAATSMNTSASTLQRHLGAEGYTFQSVKDELRRDVAILLLNTTTRSLTAIATELGFSDSATFQRAFKLWTGGPAGQYRKQQEA